MRTATSSILESICGTADDSQNVEQYDGTLGVTTAFVNAHQASMGQVQWNANLAATYTNPGNVSGVRWGSGTLISQDLFLTAGHLFDRSANGWQLPRQNGTNDVISSQEIATNMRVNFNFQFDPAGNPRPEVSFAITQLVEFRLDGLDFAIIRLAGNPAATFPIARISPADAAVGDMACVIGHPAGQPKRVEAGPVTAFSGVQIRYNDIDTLGGNSGSGIITAPDGRVVGVHTNGGCNPAGTGSNFGVRISSIIAASPTLRDLMGPRLVIDNFAYVAGGWRVDRHPRFLADITGDGRADIVGFGDAGVWISRAQPDGSFSA
jgi:V8-like Glu-specific endopeptidase